MTATRMQRHRHFQQERMARARTADDRLAAAFAWFRASARKLGKRRDGSPAARDRVMNMATDHLARMADAIDRGEFQ